MSTRMLTAAAVCLFLAVSADAVMIRGTAGDIIYRDQPLSNSFTMNAAGDCNLAGGVDNVGKIFLVKFTPPPTNLAVLGDAAFSLFSYWTEPGFTFSADVWTVVSNWTQAVVTWDNFIGSTTDPGAYSNVLGAKVGTCNVLAADAFGGGRLTGTLSGTVVQNWLDNPGNNLGLALVNNPIDGYNSCIRTVWWGLNINVDQQFEVYYNLVPEPVLMSIFAGMGFLAYRRMR
ncbi:hypothetical protein GX586_04900 [bacterium]|nr:hypothetical protein [bacterium]